MLTSDIVTTRLIHWLRNVTGVTVVVAHPGVNRPDLPYLAVDFANMVKVRQRPDRISYAETADLNSANNPIVEVTPRVEMEFTYQVFGYSKEQAEDVLLPILPAWQVRQYQETFEPELKIHNVGQIASVPELIDEKWEQRAVINIMLRGYSENSFPVDIIEQTTPTEFERNP